MRKVSRSIKLKPQRRRYRDCNQRIMTIVDDYPNRDRMRYNIAF